MQWQRLFVGLAACTVLSLAAAGVLAPRAALAVNFYSGDDLFSDCTSSNATKLPIAACAGYAVGIADALATGIAINGFKACPPASATRGQIIKAATDFLRDHPEGRRFAAAGLVANALAQAFPCPK
jgi:hypothetical protein